MAQKKVARKGPMAVDKSQTPAWMRVVIIIIAISFIGGGIVVVAQGIGGGSSNPGATGATGDSITAQYQPAVDAAVAAAKSSPDNPEVIAQVGHAYFEWAVALYEGGQQTASVPIWKSAVSYYDQVLAIDPSHDVALGNKAFALFYAQDPGAAAAIEAFLAGAADNPALAEQRSTAEQMLDDVNASAATTTTP